jgi:hypothetical protein
MKMGKVIIHNVFSTQCSEYHSQSGEAAATDLVRDDSQDSLEFQERYYLHPRTRPIVWQNSL